jgi:hypothetical protein
MELRSVHFRKSPVISSVGIGGFSLGGKATGRLKPSIHFHPVMSLKMGGSVRLLPLYAATAFTVTTLHFIFTSCYFHVGSYAAYDGLKYILNYGKKFDFF